jgi:hypothetical protein
MTMPNNPSATKAKLDEVMKAWEELAADKTFGKLTLSQFKATVQPSLDAREELAKLEKQTTSWQDRRDDADKVTNQAIQKVVKGVVGDPDFGEDSDLYEAMGYVRKSERKSGLTKKKLAAPETK